jgi:hypothetical protein
MEKPFVGRRIEKDESSCPSAVLARTVPYLDFTDDLFDSPSLRKVEDRSQDRRGDPLSSTLGRDKERNRRSNSVVQLDIEEPPGWPASAYNSAKRSGCRARRSRRRGHSRSPNHRCVSGSSNQGSTIARSSV